MDYSTCQQSPHKHHGCCHFFRFGKDGIWPSGCTPNMERHDISEYLTYDELAFIPGDVADADYDNFDDATKARCDKFVEAWYKKQGEMATEQANAAAAMEV